jgi:hypothetical protein
VTWRDGVHLSGTPIWCDARRRRDVCFVSSADRVSKQPGHGQLIATARTLELLGASQSAGHLAVPLRRRFTLGTVRLELIPSGRGPGAAALHVDRDGVTLLFAGPIRVDAPPDGDAAEVRASDIVVVAADHVAGPVSIAATLAAIQAWAGEHRAAGRRPTLVAETAVDAVELAALLPEVRVVSRGARLPKTAPVATTGGPRPTFPWPHAGTRAQLLAWIEATGASRVYLTGADAEPLARHLGPRARVLAPPRQLGLWGPAVPP